MLALTILIIGQHASLDQGRERELGIESRVTDEHVHGSRALALFERPRLPDLVEIGELRQIGIGLADPTIDARPAREHVEPEIRDRQAGPAQQPERGHVVVLVGPGPQHVDQIADLGQQQEPATTGEVGRDPPSLERDSIVLGQAPARDQDRHVASAQRELAGGLEQDPEHPRGDAIGFVRKLGRRLLGLSDVAQQEIDRQAWLLVALAQREDRPIPADLRVIGDLDQARELGRPRRRARVATGEEDREQGVEEAGQRR